MDIDTYSNLHQFVAPESYFENESELLGHFAVLLTTAIEGDNCGYLRLEESQADYFTEPSVGKRFEVYLADENFSQAAYAASSEQTVTVVNGLAADAVTELDKPVEDVGSAYAWSSAEGSSAPPAKIVEEKLNSQNTHHFFVPTFHCENSNAVIWIQKQIADASKLSLIFNRLLDLSLLSRAKSHSDSNTQFTGNENHEEEKVKLCDQLQEANQLLVESRELTVEAKSINLLSKNISVELEKEKSGFRP